MDGGRPDEDGATHGIYSGVNGMSHKLADIVSDVTAARDFVHQPADQPHINTYTPTTDDRFFQNQFTSLNENESTEPGSFPHVPSVYQTNGAGLLRESGLKNNDYFDNIACLKYEGNDLPATHVYGGPGVAHEQQMYKDGHGVDVYVHGNGDTPTVKKERLDYEDQYCHSQSPDMAYPPNTCVTDWNHYNSSNSNMNSDRFTPHDMNFPSQPVFPAQQNQMFQNHSGNGLAVGYSNLDIHQQSREITQNIVSSTWGSESMYKPHVLHAADPLGGAGVVDRKRKLSSDRETTGAKSRRRRTSETVSQSRTVGSMNKSGPPSSRQQHDPNELGSSERNALVTTLMNNLRSTVQYESFCLSLPKSEKKEAAFRLEIQRIVELMSSIEEIVITSAPFPEKYIKSASSVNTSFEKALSKDTRAAAANGDRSTEQVEDHIPHSVLWGVRWGDRLLPALWDGQIVAAVNPVHKQLCLSVFQYKPAYSAEAVQCLTRANLTKDLARDIIENMQQFEVSRQLRLSVELNSIDQLYLYVSRSNENVGCLILQANESQFHQRWIHTNAENKNQWQKRENFIAETTKVPFCVYFGGLVSELNELVAFMLACSPELEQLYKVGTEKPFQCRMQNHREYGHNGNNRTNGNNRNNDSSPGDRGQLRHELIEVLLQHGLVSEFDVGSQLINGFHEQGKGSGLDIRFHTAVSDCFRDYVNHTCRDATELSHILQSHIRARSHGFAETDFDLEKLNGRDIDTMTVGELLTSRCSDVVLYSFCGRAVVEVGSRDKHCPLCHRCNTWRHWHCVACDRCSEGVHVCQYCGHLCDEPARRVVKPLSVFRQEAAAGVVRHGDGRDAWDKSLSLSDTDVLSWPTPPMEPATGRGLYIEYSAHTDMTDELGLLNPVGFLLGQRTGGALRKHRRNSCKPPPGYEAAPKESHKGSGCNVQ